MGLPPGQAWLEGLPMRLVALSLNRVQDPKETSLVHLKQDFLAFAAGFLADERVSSEARRAFIDWFIKGRIYVEEEVPEVPHHPGHSGEAWSTDIPPGMGGEVCEGTEA